MAAATTPDAPLPDGPTPDAPRGPIAPQFETKIDSGRDASGYDNFGSAMAVDGDVLVIGAHSDAGALDGGSGSAYVYKRTASGWEYKQRLSVGDNLEYRFGSAVAVSGKVIVIGAFGDNTLGIKSGAAFVFEEENGVWEQTKKLIGEDTQDGDNFGRAVAVDGDTIAVGAPRVDYLEHSIAGAVYIFQRGGKSWLQTDRFTAGSLGATGMQFGNSVALSGNRVAVGTLANAAFVHQLHPAGSWWQVGHVTSAALGLEAGSGLGTEVAIAGDRLFLGAPKAGTGRVFVMAPELSWTTLLMELAPDGRAAGEEFGTQIEVRDDALVACSPLKNEARGACYLFEERDGSFASVAELTHGDVPAGAIFGWSAAVTGDVLVIGAPRDTLFGTNSGAAYAWKLR